ncbi:Chlorosome protein I [Paenibacillus sp. CECT 9249]|nr:Chlorosome protein I [Paenibacillus sp. CECT 9249]
MTDMIELKGRTVSKTVDSETGYSILELALKHKVDWGFSCTRGTCARCRCYIEEGADCLEEPSDAEWRRLEPEELEEGYRLGCQAVIKRPGRIVAVNKPYF